MKQDTNSPPVKLPVDDLFARRLGQHSIAPDKAGWERLQAKMAGQPEAPVLAFWRNPIVYRYAAVACVSALLLAGGWWLQRSTDGVNTPRNQVAASGNRKNSGAVVNHRNKPQSRQPTEQLAVQQSQQSILPQQEIRPNVRAAAKNEPVAVQRLTEIRIAQTKELRNQSMPKQPEIGQKPATQLAKIETMPTAISPISVSPKPVAEQVLIVTIAEPDALIEARQAANWSESAERTLVVDVAQKPVKSGKFLQQVARVRNGEGLELAGDADQSLLSRAFQTIKNKANNKSLKQ